MKQSPFTFTIGRDQWVQEIRYYTSELNPKYWERFRALGADEVLRIEGDVGRCLPDDFREFLRIFGCGSFPDPYGGDIYDPDDFAAGCHGHLWMILASSDWASDEDQRRFYVTHGAFNPAPDKYTEDALLFEDVNLLDLLQFGTNGMCCYHQVYVGARPGPLGYCMLTPERTMEDMSASFSEGLRRILTHHWFWDEPPEEEAGDRGSVFEPA